MYIDEKFLLKIFSFFNVYRYRDSGFLSILYLILGMRIKRRCLFYIRFYSIVIL